ncbi:bifunctional diaminohydroxyphosphoribosylaminopyrimidine deaminase/5-amino-6-(5-phosphoribosylamino)uracil reductase RibD [Actinomadura rubrisoli]|uniref:diaminohydroxyphosphoribosylaminopyrimidine deaminase n=1 Tax=Actinomadura rubrisoli TaxID=2530368 RepID=A0A4R5AW55_9ACTN|nr:bifunctional diaminohydroxyphosphoribosylaminopyrimidine deaminase/5-amino-6-(5-phosphoribosylamino)uracil reductase RibD [Actinomadura rubrisoli]TDD76209.1 bifunctional diaminohydroxyphosphoribosylaminopyrimidine deaminase/5-amino-6-(5-phosphoribosylamino)uracil reductase RibD [Actinomadura rubrisoli]
MPSHVELAAMRRAIGISATGLGRTSPNPPVGCVILDQEGAVVGEGYHLRKGEAHAEVNALAAAGDRAQGGTAVVTLEPCNHHGRTPPCRQALLDAGVHRVLIAVMDPTSRGDGGASVLRDAGVTVETGVLEDEALTVLGPWLTATTSGRPVVTWPYLVDGTAVRALPDELLAAEVLRQHADAILRPDGRVTEAVPDSHGPGILHLRDINPAVELPAAALKSIHGGGVRSLLLSGHADLGERFASAGLVDRIVAYLAPVTPSSEGYSGLPLPGLPRGFRITAAGRGSSMVRVEAEPI